MLVMSKEKKEQDGENLQRTSNREIEKKKLNSTSTGGFNSGLDATEEKIRDLQESRRIRLNRHR